MVSEFSNGADFFVNFGFRKKPSCDLTDTAGLKWMCPSLLELNSDNFPFLGSLVGPKMTELDRFENYQVSWIQAAADRKRPRRVTMLPAAAASARIHEISSFFKTL